MDERGRSRQVGVRRVAVAGVALAVASALGAARDARAEEAPSGAYVAVGVAGVFDQTGIDFDSGVGADVRVGGFLSEYVRLEAEYAYTGDLERSFGFFGRLEARAHTATVNLRVGLPSEVVSPFVVAGVGYQRLQAETFFARADDDAFAFRVGGGLEAQVGGPFDFFLEAGYVRSTSDLLGADFDYVAVVGGLALRFPR